ncbi:hypothetical protein AVEN_128103-1 [Araneus ventricosus]|uniref:Uncharacterized protein n=1 Tax=Araneus ventricosus TaxID=182803 RepID=A0A4Y2A0T7_ARAVE|nr:hypothetical protein AVEN_128103-1 [Araneus ventricosus]
MSRRRAEPASDSRLPARRRHWGNAATPGAFSGAGTDGSGWEQDRDYRRDDQTPLSGTDRCSSCVLRAA